MHIEHKAGDKMFVDYAGDKLMIVDRRTGREQPVEVFVAILGASQLTYAEVSFSQKSEDWIRSNERAFIYCGGVTQAIVPDNLKSGVTQSNRYEPGINIMFDDFAEYYQTVILPARVRRPQDKALVENAVKIIYQRIYAPLRNRTFFSLEELNEAIWSLLEKHNNTQFQRLKISRRGLFETTELDPYYEKKKNDYKDWGNKILKRIEPTGWNKVLKNRKPVIRWEYTNYVPEKNIEIMYGNKGALNPALG